MAVLPEFIKTIHHDVYPAIDPTREVLSAKGKFVVVTGGGSGIGPYLAEAFATAGAAKMALLGRTERTLSSTKQYLESKYGVQVSIHIADVGQEAAVNKAFQEIRSIGSIDVLVNNAGYLPDNLSIADSDIEEWWRAYDVNVKAALFVTRAMLKNTASNVVLINMSAKLAHTPPMSGLSAYATSKLASAKLFEYVQFEEPSLRVFNLHPGIIATDMSEKARVVARAMLCNLTLVRFSSSRCIFANPSIDQLPAHFSVWLASPEGAFLKGKFVWANWDVDEIKAHAKEIESTNIFTIGMTGFTPSSSLHL